MDGKLIIVFLLLPLIFFPLYFSLPKPSPLQTRAYEPKSYVQSSSIKSSVLGAEVNKKITSEKKTSSSNKRTIYLGMWTEGFWDDTQKVMHPEKLKDLENKIGKQVAIAHYYRGWDVLDDQSFISELQLISSNGWRPMVSVNPYFFGDCLSNGKPLYKAIAEGNCDAFLHRVGTIFHGYAKPLFFRFAWEMNLPEISWGIKRTGDTAHNFLLAWRRFHDIVQAEGGSNVIWVFSPNIEYEGSVPYEDLYPGNGYVDWLGLDGYNWGTTQPSSAWQSFATVFTKSYNHIITIAPSKPLMIAEVNTTDVGGDKAAWYKDMLTVQVSSNFPKIRAVVFYNEDRTQQEKVNWSIDVSEAALEAFRNSIKTNLYSSSF